MIRSELISSAHEFLSATTEFRAHEPVYTNVLATVALGVAGGRQYDSHHFWIVRDDERIVGIALRTAPWNLLVSPMPSDAAIELGRAVRSHDPHVAGVSGPRQVVDGVYRGLAPSARYHVAMTDVVYVLGDYRPPRQPTGRARLAGESDVELLVAWHEQFAQDAGVPVRDVEEFVPLRIAAQALQLWEVDGEPRAMAGRADPVPTPAGAIGRIGPVYTPAGQRRRGFGSAITASVVDELRRSCAVIMLYADAANPASNSVYLRLGFVATGELVETHLSSR